MHFPVASLKVTNNDLRPARYLDEIVNQLKEKLPITDGQQHNTKVSITPIKLVQIKWQQ